MSGRFLPVALTWAPYIAATNVTIVNCICQAMMYDGHIYWVNTGAPPHSGHVGRAGVVSLTSIYKTFFIISREKSTPSGLELTKDDDVVGVWRLLPPVHLCISIVKVDQWWQYRKDLGCSTTKTCSLSPTEAIWRVGRQFVWQEFLESRDTSQPHCHHRQLLFTAMTKWLHAVRMIDGPVGCFLSKLNTSDSLDTDTHNESGTMKAPVGRTLF